MKAALFFVVLTLMFSNAQASNGQIKGINGVDAFNTRHFATAAAIPAESYQHLNKRYYNHPISASEDQQTLVKRKTKMHFSVDLPQLEKRQDNAVSKKDGPSNAHTLAKRSLAFKQELETRVKEANHQLVQ